MVAIRNTSFSVYLPIWNLLNNNHEEKKTKQTFAQTT